MSSSNNNASTTPRRKPIITRNGASSIWESRIKMDEVKGGVKVFNGGESKEDEEGVKVLRKLRRNQSESVAEGKKRKSWKSTETTMNSIQLRKSRSEISNSSKSRVEKEKKEVGLVGNGEEMEVEKKMDGEMEKVECVVEEMDQKGIENENVEINEVELEGKVVVPIEIEEMNLDQIQSDKEDGSKEMDIETTKSCPEKIAGLVMDNRSNNPEPTKLIPEKKTAPTNDDRAVNPEPPAKPLAEKKPISPSENRSINPEPVKFSSAKSTPEKKTTPVINHRRAFKSEPRKPIKVEVQYEDVQHTTTYRNNNRLQNIVDLVMWRDVSKSAFVFGLGTFMLVSSSYTKDLNFSLISATSYMGLTYLGLIFTYRTILLRGANMQNEEGINEGCILVGEEEAIWLLRFLLPYLNELLLTLKSLFSGDPATTMKLALLLFAMARCGSFLTLWTLAKLVFFGVFTIPKICSSYSTHLARYGRFWVERFRDGWETCTHKKAVAAALFTIFWNISSTTARVWAVFMLIVAIKYYQQKMADGWIEQNQDEEEEEEEEEEETEELNNLNSVKTNQNVGNGLQHRQRRGPISFERRVKKVM
ncbi:hypothetical protein LUZ60_008807 [Juncus effusus]|nr:hypothetical protein LUZ60_008807 [Juncus effusus]